MPASEFIRSIPQDLFPDRFLDELQYNLGHRFSVLFADLLKPSLEFVGDLRYPESAHFLTVAPSCSLSRYLAARILMKSYSKKKQNEIHEARRKLKHFWLLAEAYYESHLMSASEIFSVAGSPEILIYLEPLEVLAAEQVEFPMKCGPWTSIKLLMEWYKLNNISEEMDRTLPLDQDLYQESIPDEPI